MYDQVIVINLWLYAFSLYSSMPEGICLAALRLWCPRHSSKVSEGAGVCMIYLLKAYSPVNRTVTLGVWREWVNEKYIILVGSYLYASTLVGLIVIIHVIQWFH